MTTKKSGKGTQARSIFAEMMEGVEAMKAYREGGETLNTVQALLLIRARSFPCMQWGAEESGARATQAEPALAHAAWSPG